MAQMNRIKSFKSFTEVIAQENAIKLAQENATKRGELSSKFSALLDEMEITSLEELEEDKKRELISKFFGNVSEEEAGLPAEDLEDETKDVTEPTVDTDGSEMKHGSEVKDVEKDLELEGEGDAESEEIKEGRAFIFAASKAKKEGKTEFEWNGKKYPVTLKENENGEEVTAEDVNEGKKERSSVVNAWKKSGVKELNAIAKVYADAMEDANFHPEISTSKAIGSASKAKDQGKAYSDIANAAKWDGYAIANGTVDYLKEIGENDAADKLLNAITKFNLNESVNLNSLEQIIEEGTRGQFGKIYKSGEIASVYTHYDSYPEHMLPTIKKGYKSGSDVDAVITKGDNSGLEADIDKIKFYNDKNSMKPLTGSMKNLKKYINDADANGAEYAYLYDERDSKWYMIDIYGDRELVPAFESVVSEKRQQKDLSQTYVSYSTDAKQKKMYIVKVEAGKDFVFSEIQDARKDAPKEFNDMISMIGQIPEDEWLEFYKELPKEGDIVKIEKGLFEKLNTLYEAEVEMDAMDPDNKDFLKFLKKNNVKIINKQMDGPAGGHPVILMQGKRKDLETVLADCDYGWCDEDLAEYIEESKVYEAEVDIIPEINGEFMQLYSKLNDLAEETTDSKWRKAIEGIIKNLEGVENKIGQTASKLGIVPTHESEEIVFESEMLNDYNDAFEVSKKYGIPVALAMATIVSMGIGAAVALFKKGARAVTKWAEENDVKESKVNEAEVTSDDEFKEYAFSVLQKAFGEDYDEAKAMEVVDGILGKVDGDYGAAIGMLTSSLGESLEVNESKEEDEAYSIMQDLLDERDPFELEMMEPEEAEEVVSSYGHKGSKAKKIAQYLYNMASTGAFESVTNEAQQLDAEAQAFLDTIRISDSSIKDLKHITVDATPKGNWAVYYKGRSLMTVNGELLSDETIMKYALEHYS